MDGKQINLISLAPGAVVRVNGDAWMRVTENPGDGLWIFGIAVDGHGETIPGAREENLCVVDILEVLPESQMTNVRGS
ncbi:MULTISPECIES: hypothetical protein [Aminobacter]|uniref:Uncharacterized protein n=2 Tax=Aminobacter TaxID=31988 RepID=A0AAC8YKI9_AMIAI|nr:MULTISPECIES: hypothetical protein [Aminobacter]AMS40130.1 hypothetical protein AA2016_1194 [Aminobacter aminovorans]MBB3710137.1 hypothetical protein [Aminobacter aminovorans]MBB6465604.1 hypothetical protein [Aminobacter lissarensis]